MDRKGIEWEAFVVKQKAIIIKRLLKYKNVIQQKIA